MGKKSTYHSKNGKFTSYDQANIVNDGGQKFRMVRKLEPVDDKQGDGSPPPDVATAENVAKVKAKVDSLASRIAPQWLPLDEVVGQKFVSESGPTASGQIAYTKGRFSLSRKNVRGAWRYFVDAGNGNYREVPPKEARVMFDKAKKKLVHPDDAFEQWG